MNEFINSNRPVTLYISAASDLMTEREMLGQMIASLPVTLAWRIIQTPLGVEPLNLEAVRQADLYILILGGDIRAPIGLEWHTAYQARRPIIAFLKQGTARTLAGQAFGRDTGADWQPFANTAHLRWLVERHMVEFLLHHAIQYALTPVEIEQLTILLKAGTEDSQPVSSGEGTGHSAIILSRERYSPSEGVIIEP
jgi:hypothetical protein